MLCVVHLKQVGRVDWYRFLSLSTAGSPTDVSPWIIVGGVAGGIVVIGILVCICGTIIAGMRMCSVMYRGSVMWTTL